MELQLLWRDDELVVVDKPAGMLVVGAPGRGAPVLVEVLAKQIGGRVFPVHRLDEDTTGVLVVARTERAREALDGMLRRREVERVYLAAVPRVPSPPAGRIESRLVESSDGVVRSTTGRGGKTAVTSYRTLERRDYGALLECRLETGRRNQIRAHLAELGCPILGDRKYGYRVRGGGKVPSRPLLHAASVAFAHPVTGERIEVACVAPEPELRPRG